MSTDIDFPFSTEDMKLLALMAEEKSVKNVASRLGRDVTTISRQLTTISQKFPVLQKNNNSWTLTSYGIEVAKFARRIFHEQNQLAGVPRIIKVATTKEFSEWVLGPLLKDIIDESHESFKISVITEVDSFERALLDGVVDLVFTCGKPIDPIIKYKKIRSLRFACVSSIKGHSKHKLEHLHTLPAVEHTGMTIRSLLQDKRFTNVVAQFDHIAGVRGACRAGLGWAILPYYAIEKDINHAGLYEIPLKEIESIKEEYSLWHVRGYSYLDNIVKTILTSFTKEPVQK